MKHIPFCVRRRFQEGIDEGKFLFAIASLDQVYWVAGSIIGAVAGKCTAI